MLHKITMYRGYGNILIIIRWNVPD